MTSSTQLGAYHLVRPVAQGGMANIYLARRTDAELHVAVKVLNENRASDAEACTMFLDEARIVAMLSHANIASVLDADVTAEGRYYLAMEYVHGADLRELLSAAAHANRSLPYATSIAIVAGAAAGLDHAHRRCSPEGKPLRLVHRDVSLSNIMVGHDGSVKVVDFGIASTTLATVQTSPGIVRGKASYMSPEQCLGDRVDHRTDVFALGIVLYELTTGARCFSGKSDFDRMLAVVRGDYIQPRDIVADFPQDLEQVIRCALSIDATQRFASAAAMLAALDRVLLGHGWIGDQQAIQTTMCELFGSVPEPWTIAAAEPVVTETHAIVAAFDHGATVQSAPQLVPPQPPRLARGTESDLPPSDHQLARGSEVDLRQQLDGWAPTPGGSEPDDDDDQPTRGRRSLRRPPSAPNISA